MSWKQFDEHARLHAFDLQCSGYVHEDVFVWYWSIRSGGAEVDGGLEASEAEAKGAVEAWFANERRERVKEVL